jgi:hypothetical protein
MAVGPSLEGLQPRVLFALVAFVQDDYPDLPPAKIVPGSQILPVTFDNLTHDAPHWPYYTEG